MLHIPRWKIILILLMCALSFAYSAPNLFSKEAREWAAASLPSWMPHKTVNLGLDLQGGSHLQLQVEVAAVLRQRTDDFTQALRPELRKEKIGYTRISALPDGFRLTLKPGQDMAALRKIVRGVDPELVLTASDDGETLEARLTPAAIKAIEDQAIEQSIEIVRRRVDETGTREPIIARQGNDRIIVQLPGLDDPQRVKEILGKTAKLSFHLVDTGMSGVAAGNTRTLPFAEEPGQTITIDRKAMLTGDMLVNAQPAFEQGMAVVSFRLNAIGAKRFCEVTRENVNKPFAIVLDEVVISAPNIRQAICGGSAIISGSFTVDETNNLAILLRAGALPAPLHVMEERTVGPSLGADSVEAGKIACLVGVLFVVVMTVGVYGLFGVFASLALLINIAMIFAIMSALQATLTLPGIAGIVLTIGMAVDANVLIFERMKEELRSGQSIMAAMDAGYQRALSTITDSNLTTLIAALILFSFGTGPIKGFAVTMSIGVVTSYISAVMITRLMVLAWLRWKKPAAIPV